MEELRIAMVKPEHAEQKLQEGREIVAKFAEPHPLKVCISSVIRLVGGRTQS
jgi:hypothetical protein